MVLFSNELNITLKKENSTPSDCGVRIIICETCKKVKGTTADKQCIVTVY